MLFKLHFIFSSPLDSVEWISIILYSLHARSWADGEYFCVINFLKSVSRGKLFFFIHNFFFLSSLRAFFSSSFRIKFTAHVCRWTIIHFPPSEFALRSVAKKFPCCQNYFTSSSKEKKKVWQSSFLSFFIFRFCENGVNDVKSQLYLKARLTQATPLDGKWIRVCVRETACRACCCRRRKGGETGMNSSKGALEDDYFKRFLDWFTSIINLTWNCFRINFSL